MNFHCCVDYSKERRCKNRRCTISRNYVYGALLCVHINAYLCLRRVRNHSYYKKYIFICQSGVLCLECTCFCVGQFYNAKITTGPKILSVISTFIRNHGAFKDWSLPQRYIVSCDETKSILLEFDNTTQSNFCVKNVTRKWRVSWA